MNAINQNLRPAIRTSALPGGAASSSSSADGESQGQAASANSSAGNGALLRSLDANSRRNALPSERDATSEQSEPTSNDGDDTSMEPGAASQGDAAVKTAIATDSAGTQAADAAIANSSPELEDAKAKFQENLTQLASDPKAFHEAMQKAFGDSYDTTKAEAIRQQVLEGDFSWMPDIQVVDQSVLQDQSGTQTSGTALGAYSKDTDTIYISQQLLESDPDKALQILTEEVGHGLDARLNTSDAAGDEGDIFSRLVGGEAISDAELADLKAENDSGVIIVDGKEVEVEYGLFSGVKKFAKKVVGGVKDAVSGAVDAVSDAVSSVADSVSSAFDSVVGVWSDAWSAIGDFYTDTFKKITQSKWFGTVMMVAQFIPIPIVQVAVRVVNIAMAAYSVYQGVKHGSVSAVLGGVASMAGGVGKIGGILGKTGGVFATATKVANVANQASAAYQVLAKGDFTAAASFASNYFGGTSTEAGRIFDTASKVSGTYDKVQDGDVLGAIQTGRSAYSSFDGLGATDVSGTSDTSDTSDSTVSSASSVNSSPAAERGGVLGFVDDVKGFVDDAKDFVDDVKGSKTFQAIKDNVSTVRGIVDAVKEGDYRAATEVFLSNFADDLGIDANNQETITQWAGVLETANDVREHVVGGDYTQAIEEAAEMLGIPLSQSNRTRLETAFQIRDSVQGRDLATASRQAASLSLQSGQPELAGTFLNLANLLEGKIKLSDLFSAPKVDTAA